MQENFRSALRAESLNFLMKLNAKSKIFAPRCARKAFNLLKELKESRENLSVRDYLSVREVPPGPQII